MCCVRHSGRGGKNIVRQLYATTGSGAVWEQSGRTVSIGKYGGKYWEYQSKVGVGRENLNEKGCIY